MVLLPAAAQVGGVPVIAGTAGAAIAGALLKDALAAELQLPSLAITVYPVPVAIPVITPPVPTAGPVGVNE